MSRLETYRKLAPYTIDELVEAANSVLRDKPRLQVTKRTVRYYIGQGIISPPTGAPKYARYPFESLLRIVGARTLLDQGVPLEQSREMLDRLIAAAGNEAERQVGDWLVKQDRTHPSFMVAEPPAAFEAAMEPRLSGPTPLKASTPPILEQEVRRISLAPGLVLEADTAMTAEGALEAAHDEIEKLLGLSPHST